MDKSSQWSKGWKQEIKGHSYWAFSEVTVCFRNVEGHLVNGILVWEWQEWLVKSFWLVYCDESSRRLSQDLNSLQEDLEWIEKYLWGCALPLYGRGFHSCDYIGMLMGKNKWHLEDPSTSRKWPKGKPKQTCPFLSWPKATEVRKEGTIQIWKQWCAQPYWKDVSCQ